MNDSNVGIDDYCSDPSCTCCMLAKFENKLEQVAHKIDYRITQPQLEAAFKAVYNIALAN